MTTILEPHVISQYLNEVQRLFLAGMKNPCAVDDLVGYILEQKEAHHKFPVEVSFFNGEYAFYNENYEQALVHYLKARTLPYFEFFCYRASAYISFIRGERRRQKGSFLKR